MSLHDTDTTINLPDAETKNACSPPGADMWKPRAVARECRGTTKTRPNTTKRQGTCG